MRKLLVLGLLFILFLGCTPVKPVSQPTSQPPPPTVTPAPENPPACAGAKLIYHSQLQEMLLIGCAQDSDREDHPNIIWGWNGERWHKVTDGGPLLRVL